MKDKVVIITGASSGIGKALAFSFGREGAKIIITGRKETSLMEVSQELSKAGIENFALVSDVSIEADNIEMVEKTIQKYGKIDILVNNAAEQHPKDSIEKISEKQLVKTFRTNIFSFFFFIVF